jgi:hypothetical protein
MKDHETLLVYSSGGNIRFIFEDDDSDRQALPPLSLSVRGDQAHDRPERLISLPHLKERVEGPPPLTAAAQAFLAQYVPPAVLEVFPEWQGMLIESPTRGEAVWIVRDPQDGRRLTQETGQPFVLLAEILALEGQS